MKKYFKIQVKTTSADEAEIVIAELSDIKFYAFEQENDAVNAFITQEDFDEGKLKESLPTKAIYTKTIIEEENWNQQWEDELQPVIVNEFVAIRTDFHKPIKNVKHELIITPKMSFGTGHHATTFLMIEMMQQLNFGAKNVIDFGTGTAVLAILAEKCGASKVIAIDYDEWSVLNAIENMQANDCKVILIKQQGNLSGIDSADIILANINLNVLKNESASIAFLLKPGAFLLVSGFLFSDEKQIQEIFEKEDLVKRKTNQKGDWLAILFEKP